MTKNKNMIFDIVPKNSTALITLEHVTKKFGHGSKQFVAVNDVSIKFYENQNVAILGSNGAGKTTIVEMILGLNKPTGGKILYHLCKNEKEKFKTMGIQFQDSTYPNFISVRRIIKFIKDAYDSDLTKTQLDEMIDVFGIRSYYNRDASSLSGGQLQRLNILLAIMHKPKIIFLDELSTGLDITIRNNIKKFVKDYCIKNKMTIVIVSHDINEILYLADRIIIMDHGKVTIDNLKDNILKINNNLEDFISKHI